MAFVTMNEAVAGEVAHAADYNDVVNNVLDVNTRLTTLSGVVGSGTFTEVDNISAWANSAQAAITAMQTEVFGGAGRSTKPMVKLRLNANQTFANQTNVMLNWQVEDFDSANMHTGTEQRVTIPVAGKYLNVVTVNLASNSSVTTGSLGAKLLLNSTDPDPGPAITSATATAPFNSAGEGPVVTLTAVTAFAAGDQLRVSGWHNFANGSTPLSMTIIPGLFEQVGTTWTCVYLGK